MSKSIHNYSEICSRYAKALLQIYKSPESVEKVLKNFELIFDLKEKSFEFKSFIENPLLSCRKKIDIINKMLKSLKLDKNFANFLKVLAQHKRLFALEKIHEHVIKFQQIKNNETYLEVTTTSPLDKNLENKLIKKVSDSIGKKITIINSIDKNILGGMILKIDSLMIDFSIKTKLNNYKISMKGEV